MGAQKDEFDCSVLEYDVHQVGTYWLVVEGKTKDDKGVFSMSVVCNEVPSPAPTPVPTGLPTPSPSPVPTLEPR